MNQRKQGRKRDMTTIVIAPDSFKGTLTAAQAAAAMTGGIHAVLPDAEIIACPLADGGEGTAEVLAPYLAEGVCLIESARLLGLNLPEMQALHVMQRGSWALGLAMRKGLDAGLREFVIGLGGSATNDGGLGMLMALGMQAFDAQGRRVAANLAGLLSVQRVDMSTFAPELAQSRLTILSDVASPLCGPEGATAVYGPQKGISGEDIQAVDDAMARFARLCGQCGRGEPLMDMPGAGAAGGLGFALMLLDGELVSGAEYVMAKSGFSRKLATADWVISGEGRSDAQTLQGKLPCQVLKAAKVAGCRTALISGSLDASVMAELLMLADHVLAAGEDMPANQAEAARGLRAAASVWARGMNL